MICISSTLIQVMNRINYGIALFDAAITLNALRMRSDLEKAFKFDTCNTGGGERHKLFMLMHFLGYHITY